MGILSLAEGSLLEFLSNWVIIVAIVLLVIGIALALVSKRIVMFKNQSEIVPTNDKKLVLLRTISIIIICIGLLFFIIGAAILGGIF